MRFFLFASMISFVFAAPPRWTFVCAGPGLARVAFIGPRHTAGTLLACDNGRATCTGEFVAPHQNYSNSCVGSAALDAFAFNNWIEFHVDKGGLFFGADIPHCTAHRHCRFEFSGIPRAIELDIGGIDDSPGTTWTVFEGQRLGGFSYWVWIGIFKSILVTSLLLLVWRLSKAADAIGRE
eukprot:NODE_1798_length_735_cov_227.851974_g1748_i0.p1 GENE.NODE_1798_length_735_cov_227.851974_g1748_i0~~NODE_1798_length_735_cov_227.851974_g1748_i0.p1  ORF type:complete len:180 (-),score=10.74 NODE_1798_length_735_cov_227.851974_g1748_i0:106-645(-)